MLLWGLKVQQEYDFKTWILLEDKKERILESAKNKQADFPDHLFGYISLATGVTQVWYRRADWIRVVLLFYACLSKSPQVKLPITSPTDTKSKNDPWTYPSRHWYLYSHIIAQAYGWTLKEISRLKVFDALAIIQEIMTDKQLEREFQYGLSEIAYPYNSQTKKSIFKPLDRPDWMRPTISHQDIPRFEIPKSFLPEGVVLMDNVLPDEYLPKEKIH